MRPRAPSGTCAAIAAAADQDDQGPSERLCDVVAALAKQGAPMSDMAKPPEWVVSCKARIRKGLQVEMTMGSPDRISCKWDPGAPRRLTSRQTTLFRRARDELIAEFLWRTMIDHGLVVEVEVVPT